MFELGDIVLFTDYINNQEKKTRPLVILKTVNDNGAVIGVRCTTKARDYDDYSYEITDWKACGLAKPSSVRCDKTVFLSNSRIYTDDDGNPIIAAKLSHESIKEVVERFNKYQEELAAIAAEVKELTKEQVVFAIKVTETIGDDNSVQYKIYDDEETAKDRYSKCCSEFTRTVINGRMVDVNTKYELGTMKIINRSEVDEQSFTEIATTTDLSQHNSIFVNKR